MSARTRHAAELAARLTMQAHENHQRYGVQGDECRGDTGSAFPTIARDADKLLRLSASLKGIAEKETPQCKMCRGIGARLYRGTENVCGSCGGSGHDSRRERRLIQAVTDTLKPYGLTWKDAGVPEGRVSILFPGHGQGGWRV